jgi:hypothetical protein
MQTCPKCGYTRQPADFSKPEWACPACGIVYAKYRPPVARGPRPSAPVPPAPEPVSPLAERWGRIFEGVIIAVVLAWVVVTYAGLLNLRYLMGITLLFPWIALALVGWQPDLFTFRIRTDATKDKRKASVMPLLLVSGFLLAFGAPAIWKPHDELPPILLGIAAGLVMTGLFAALSAPLRQSWMLAGAFWLQAAFYAGGAAVFLNGALDRGEARVYPMRVLGKFVSEGGGRGSGTRYYLKTSAPSLTSSGWTEYKVNRAMYERLNRDDFVCMVQRPGSLGISWYRLRGCEAPEVARRAGERTAALKKFGMDYAMQIYEMNHISRERLPIMKRVEEALAGVDGSESQDHIRMLVHSAYKKEGFKLAE